MNRMMYAAGYLSIALSTTGLLCKLQHWPGAAVLMLSGIVLLNVVYLPLFFMKKARV